ncbi:unnamed protein product [Ambrosiozyma monospora]|uniref:Unnamed protein product n=1 Tax=Ambrosiozyma monospora TaxID=43982 RepID=A0A9W6YY21_AMBMO|nr:unnamed protein product [Ambrosiozyma monospora]
MINPEYKAGQSVYRVDVLLTLVATSILPVFSVRRSETRDEDAWIDGDSRGGNGVGDGDGDEDGDGDGDEILWL